MWRFVWTGRWPFARPTWRAAELLKVDPKDCWVIEDSKPGVAAGLAAGMRVIAITNTHPAEELDHATHVVETYEQIERLLDAQGISIVFNIHRGCSHVENFSTIGALLGKDF